MLHELEDEYREAQAITTSLTMKGIGSYWELGPICSRNHAWQLADLKKFIKEFLAVLPNDIEQTKEYRRAFQNLHMQLKSKP